MREGWEYKKIKDICAKGSSNIVQSKIEGLSGDYAVFGASGYVQNVDFYHQEDPYIGIVKDGSGVGRVNIYPAKSSLIGTLQYIIPKEGFNINYVAYALKSKNLSSFAAGAAIPHIYFKDYGECELSVPPLSVQQQIVEELDLLSGIIEKKRQQLKEYDVLAESIFYDMFGDPVENPKGWKSDKIENCTEKTKNALKAGPFGSALKKEFYVSDGYKVYGQEQVIANDANFGNYYIDETKYNELKSCAVKSDDVLISLVGTFGKLLIIPKVFREGIINPRLVKISFDKQIINTIYFKFFFTSQSLKNVLESNSHGQTMGILNLSIIKSFTIPLPPLSLQQSFAAKIEALEQQKQLIKESLKETETLFQSRMDYWFNS